MDTTPEAAAGWLELFDRFGVSIVMLGLAIATGAYILRRLLSPKDGILTSYGRTVESSHQKLTESYERLEQTDAEVARLLAGQTEQLDGIDGKMTETGGRVQGLAEASIESQEAHRTYMRLAEHYAGLFRVVAKKMDASAEVEPHLEAIKKELEKHQA